MQSPSSTFISRTLFLLIFLAALALPLLAVGSLVAPVFNGLRMNADLTRIGIENAANKPIILMGESTIRALDNEPTAEIEDPDFLNLALPGGNGGDSLEALRIALLHGAHAPVVIMGTVMTGAAIAPASFTGYLPSLLTYGEILTLTGSGRFTAAQGLELSFRRLFPLLNAREDIVLSLLRKLSASAATVVGTMDSAGTGRFPGLVGGSPESVENAVLEIADLARRNGRHFVFFLGPFESWARKTWMFQRNHEAFQAICQPPLECWDLSEALPDGGFHSDGFHLSDSHLALFRSLLKEKVAKLR